MSIKIAFINNKGGCGKSTSLFHLAGEFAKRGFKVLVADFDKQGDTTSNFLSEEESAYNPKDCLTVLDYMQGNCSFEEVVKKNYIRVGNKNPAYYGIDVIPSDKRLENQSMLYDLIQNTDIKTLFSQLDYDYIMIDCPPSNKAVEKIVLEQIATAVIVPLSTDVNTIRGYGALVDKVNNANQNRMDDLKIVGLFFSMYFRNRAKHKEYRNVMIKKYPELFIDVQIPNCTDIVKSLEDKGQPISFYHKETVGARAAIEKLADEMINRL